jgi:choloylglycine hydrolase
MNRKFERAAVKFALVVVSLTLLAAFAGPAQACTRVLYTGDGGLVIAGRSMDWGEDMYSKCGCSRAHVARRRVRPNTVKWKSKHGSLVVSSYESGTADGINEKGVVMNGLYLAESDYGKPDGRPTISIMAAGQFALDNFGSVAEAVEYLRRDPMRVIAPTLPNGRARRRTCRSRTRPATPRSSNGSTAR